MSSPLPVVAITDSLYKSKTSIFCASVLLRPLSDRFNNQYKLYRIESGINNMPTSFYCSDCFCFTGGCLQATSGFVSFTFSGHSSRSITGFYLLLTTYLLLSWTAKKTNEWILKKAGVKRELLDTVKARKLAYYGHTMRKQGSCLEKEIMQGTMSSARRRGRPRTAWVDNIKTWTGLSAEESIRMTEDRDNWRKYVHGVANPRIEDG